MSEWKPIESAPKDGTVVWLWGTAVGCEEMNPAFWTEHGWHHFYNECWIVEASLWQHLPSPPGEPETNE